jgi:thiol-disulfide isomerase/thioredoxin
MKNAFVVLAIVAAGLFGLPRLGEGQIHQLGAYPPGHYRYVGSDPLPEGVKLYKRTTAEQRELAKTHPEIAAADCSIVVFGASWCVWCRTEVQEMEKAKAGDAYRIAILDIDEEKNKTLMERWGLGDPVPVTVIVDRGKVVKRFDGYVGWDEIKPHADKAKKNENEQADSDGFWFFRDPWGGSVVDLDRQGRNRRRY